jgi:hypothetical protein
MKAHSTSVTTRTANVTTHTATGTARTATVGAQHCCAPAWLDVSFNQNPFLTLSLLLSSPFWIAAQSKTRRSTN